MVQEAVCAGECSTHTESIWCTFCRCWVKFHVIFLVLLFWVVFLVLFLKITISNLNFLDPGSDGHQLLCSCKLSPQLCAFIVTYFTPLYTDGCQQRLTIIALCNYLSSQFCRLMFFIKFEEFSAMILSDILSDPLALFSPSGTPIMSILIYFMVGFESLSLSSFFFLSSVQIG